MKKIITIIVTLVSLNVHAGLYDGDYFEPLIGGGAGFYMAYTADPANLQNMVILTGIGLLAGHFLNSYYRHKHAQQDEIVRRQLDEVRKRFQTVLANEAASGIPNQYGIVIRDTIPGERAPDGSVRAPTIREKLISPDAGLPVGN